MRTIFLMQPRQSGKTTKAIYEFLKEPDNSIFVVHNNSMLKYIHTIVGSVIEKKIITSNQFHVKIIGNRFKNIILDEYMFFKNKDEIYKYIHHYDYTPMIRVELDENKYSNYVASLVNIKKI